MKFEAARSDVGEMYELYIESTHDADNEEISQIYKFILWRSETLRS